MGVPVVNTSRTKAALDYLETTAFAEDNVFSWYTDVIKFYLRMAVRSVLP